MKLFTTLVTAFLVLVGAWASFGSTSKPETTQTYNLVEKLVELDKQRHLVEKRKHLVQITKHLVRFADKTPYVYSGSSTFGWDCSGMVVWAYSQVDVELPHSANKQAHAGKRVSKPQIGDIVVFAHSGSTNFYHSAIYLGDGKIINANLLYKTTKIQLLTDFKKSQIRFVRILP
jgi:cell wall-associated NlpC family hydrolase